jgi:hypothetical protein
MRIRITMFYINKSLKDFELKPIYIIFVEIDPINS